MTKNRKMVLHDPINNSEKTLNLPLFKKEILGKLKNEGVLPLSIYTFLIYYSANEPQGHFSTTKRTGIQLDKTYGKTHFWNIYISNTSH